MSVGNPLESQKFTGYLRVLDRMKKDGYMSDDLTNEITYLNNPGLNDAHVLKNVKEGNLQLLYAMVVWMKILKRTISR